MKLGHEDGTVTVRTGVAGSAARMGHRLVMPVQDWSAVVDLDGQTPVHVRFTAQLDSLRVQSGTGGVTPLTVVDKQVIRRNAAKVMQADEFPEAIFDGDLAPADGGYMANGDLQIHGVSQPLSALIAVSGQRVTASIAVTQSDFGIKPYSAMLGQLKVLDDFVVDLDIEVPD